ncbi:MAG: hypothetical protein AVDCRST_MAG05-1042, partial [uncultured Rubrobacteraceae bacterium]
ERAPEIQAAGGGSLRRVHRPPPGLLHCSPGEHNLRPRRRRRPRKAARRGPRPQHRTSAPQGGPEHPRRHRARRAGEVRHDPSRREGVHSGV